MYKMKGWIIFGLIFALGVVFFFSKPTQTKRSFSSSGSVPEYIDQDPIFIKKRNPLAEKL